MLKIPFCFNHFSHKMVQSPVTCRLSIDVLFIVFNPFWVYYLSIIELPFEHVVLLKYSSYPNQQPFGILPVCSKNQTQDVWDGNTGVYVALIFVTVEENVILWSHIPSWRPIMQPQVSPFLAAWSDIWAGCKCGLVQRGEAEPQLVGVQLYWA